jgi:hypothetical protein
MVGDRGFAAPPSKQRARCNLLARALFGRPVFDEEDGTLLDEELAGHGYQLCTAAVGSIIEAQSRGFSDAVLVIHQFRPTDRGAGYSDDDTRDWPRALEDNQAAFERFCVAVEDAGGRSFETPFVQAGTRLTALKVETRVLAGRRATGARSTCSLGVMPKSDPVSRSQSPLRTFYNALHALDESELTAIAEAHADDPGPLVRRFRQSVKSGSIVTHEPFHSGDRADPATLGTPLRRARSTTPSSSPDRSATASRRSGKEAI